MNYKTIISFLATKQQKNWAKPVSDWMLAGDGSIGWTDEFMKANHLKGRHDKYSPNRTLDIIDGTLSKNSWGCNSGEKLYYYSDDKKLMFMISKRLIAKHGADVYFDFIDSVDLSGGYIEIPKELKLL